MILLIFVKKTDFDEKLNGLNKKVTSKKTQYGLVENELIELSKSGSNIDKRINKYLINNYSVLNGAKSLSSNVLQNYLAFTSANK